jgi:hypothetical protein
VLPITTDGLTPVKRQKVRFFYTRNNPFDSFHFVLI